MYGLPYYERGNQAMHGEVVPYNGSNNPQDTKTTSIGSTTKKTSLGSKTYSTTEIESTEKNIQTSHATDMTTAESSKHYLR